LRPSPVRTAALRSAHRANAPRGPVPVTAQGEARVAWKDREVAPTACRKSFCGRRGGPSSVPLPGGDNSHLGEGQAAGRAVGRSHCGGGVVPGARGGAYEQSRNVLWFHGHNARDSTFDQGFRLRSGGGGWGFVFCVQRPRYGTRRQVGVRQGEDLFGTPPRGSWRPATSAARLPGCSGPD
jgi:hypothetical protein